MLTCSQGRYHPAVTRAGLIDSVSPTLSTLPLQEADPFLAVVHEHHRLNELVGSLGPEERAAFLARIPGGDSLWEFRARPEQLPPKDLATIWLLLGGRGAGKSESLYRSVHMAVQAGAKRIHVVCPTSADVRDVAVLGPSGLLATAPAGMRPTWIETKRALHWPNGAQALTFSAEEPDSLRGPECELVAIDELARMGRAESVFDMAMLGCRIGRFPRMLIATTPQPSKLIKSLVGGKIKGVSLSRSTTYDNEANLAPSFLQWVKDEYEHRKLGLQELWGQIVESDDLDLFLESWIRHDPVADVLIERVMVGVDPSGGADVVGIVACAKLTVDNHYAVLADRSVRGSPAAWSEAVVRLHDELGADLVVCESNFGGQMAEDTIRNAAQRMAERGEREDEYIRVQMVVASRGKTVRAEPISALYERGRVLHRPGLQALEAEMMGFHSNWSRERDGSPNRVDALVWCLTRLKEIRNICIA